MNKTHRQDSVMQGDFFSNRRKAEPADDSIQDYEYRVWADRLIREVSEEVSREERKTKDFVTALVRWNDLSSFLSYIDLTMHRRHGRITATELQWHETVLTGLISLGGLIVDWSQAFDDSTLETIGFDKKEIETKMSSLRESFEDWHTEMAEKRFEHLESFLPPCDAEK